ncbi:type III polyketide synthase [Streptomyces atriruber]|uniref:type III polyketide synthase n=1 Tax=Streptomyces atriruber TaxID=545121 RepID=UPI0006E4182B|nr:type III polyketide synthase [Streptomyces atriruber]
MSPTAGARILGLSTAHPGLPLPQDELYETFYADFYREVPDAEQIFKATQVRTRHMAWDPREHFAGRTAPSMSERMRGWEENVLALGAETVGSVLKGVDTADVGSFTMASCTGYAGPTPEMLLAKEFGLPVHLRRTFVGHMGCYAAFNALKVGLDSVTARPDELAVVSCCEICSLHVRPEMTKEQVVVHGLFADGAAAVLLGPDDGRGPAVLRTHTETHYATSEAMTWRVQDDGFRMTLSPYVPAILSGAVESFVENLLRPMGLSRQDVRHWGVHPGGPKIIDLVGARLGLTDAQLAASRHILASRGNCSSSTILLILEQLLAGTHDAVPRPGEFGVLMAFGPGLTMESALVRF